MFLSMLMLLASTTACMYFTYVIAVKFIKLNYQKEIRIGQENILKIVNTLKY